MSNKRKSDHNYYDMPEIENEEKENNPIEEPVTEEPNVITLAKPNGCVIKTEKSQKDYFVSKGWRVK